MEVAEREAILRKTIKNKVYDTDKAMFVGGIVRAFDDDSNRIEENLYRKRTGEYFLYGSGGQVTRYAMFLGGNSWSDGDMITPLSYEQARAWAQEELTAEEYEREFGSIIDEDESEEVRIGVRVSRQTKRLLDREVSRTGKSCSAVVERIIRDSLA